MFRSLGILQKSGQIVCAHHHDTHADLNTVLSVVQIVDRKIHRIKRHSRLIQIKQVSKLHMLFQIPDKIRVVCRFSHCRDLIQGCVVQINSGYVAFQQNRIGKYLG